MNSLIFAMSLHVTLHASTHVRSYRTHLCTMPVMWISLWYTMIVSVTGCVCRCVIVRVYEYKKTEETSYFPHWQSRPTIFRSVVRETPSHSCTFSFKRYFIRLFIWFKGAVGSIRTYFLSVYRRLYGSVCGACKLHKRFLFAFSSILKRKQEIWCRTRLRDVFVCACVWSSIISWMKIVSTIIFS